MIKNNSDNDLSLKIDSSVFLRIGQSLCKDNEYSFIDVSLNTKTQEEYKRDYFLKLDEIIKSFENKKNDILNDISFLTIHNKKISDKIKLQEYELNIIQSKISFPWVLNKEKNKKLIQEDKKIYKETFEKITSLHEEIINLNEYIKKTKSYYY
jgi:hypothetical protein